MQSEVPELVELYRLPERAARQLSGLLELIVNDPRAPTSVRDPGAIGRDHLADSLVALELQEVKEACTVLDIGAGAGFPGLALAIALANARVVLLEASGRKCGFIAEVIRSLRVENAVAVHARAESWIEGREQFDLVTARAVGSLALVAEYAAPMLRIRGSLVAWKGRLDPQEAAAAEHAAGELGLEVRAALRVKPYPTAQHRHLHVMTKVRSTPSRFPRRPGVARKRPLGSGPAASRLA